MKTIRRVVAFSLCIMLALSLTLPAFAFAYRAKATVRIRRTTNTSSTSNVIGQIYSGDLFWLSYIYTTHEGRVWYRGVPDEDTEYYQTFGNTYGWAARQDESGNMLFW